MNVTTIEVDPATEEELDKMLDGIPTDDIIEVHMPSNNLDFITDLANEDECDD